MKFCNKCETLKDESEFAKSSKRIDGLQVSCKSCMSLYAKARYERIKPRRRAQNEAWRVRSLERFKEYKQTLSCVDCGVTDWRVLEFDHLDNDKIGNVSDLVSKWSWTRLKLEIDKCDPVCANCHRIRTHERRLAVG